MATLFSMVPSEEFEASIYAGEYWGGFLFGGCGGGGGGVDVNDYYSGGSDFSIIFPFIILCFLFLFHI